VVRGRSGTERRSQLGNRSGKEQKRTEKILEAMMKKISPIMNLKELKTDREKHNPA
jgi:hypothetical protein